MNRIGLRLIAVVLGSGIVVGPAAAQVPIYLPSAPAVAPSPPLSVTIPSPVADPAPVYTPAVPNLSLAQPPSANTSPLTPPPPIYRPSTTPYAPGPSAAPNYSTLPGYGGTPSAQTAPPSDGAMPYGTFDRGNFNSDPQLPPRAKSRWLPTTAMPLPPGYGPGGLDAVCGPNAACGNGTGCGPAGTGCDPCAASSCGCNSWYDNLSVFAGYDAFKGPLDLDGLNGNFGKRIGFNAALPVWAPWGIGVQASGSAGWYDWKGSQFTGDGVRFQNFWTVGVFQRSCKSGFGWGIAYDWLYDDYWASMRFGQWRFGASLQVNACNEIGVWGALPDRRASTTATGTLNQFQSLAQGGAYWRRNWSCSAWSTIYGGVAESPSDAVWGCNNQVALNCYVAMYANATYVLPATGGLQGHQDEIWNLSVGFSFYPGSAMRIAQSQFRPFFTPADNGNFAVWRK